MHVLVTMDSVNNVLHDSYQSYFNVLSKVGYVNYDRVSQLLILTFIQELLTGDLGIHISEEDYRTISRVLTCIYGSSCLISYPEYINDDSLANDEGITGRGRLIRVTQDNIIRVSQTDITREKA